MVISLLSNTSQQSWTFPVIHAKKKVETAFWRQSMFVCTLKIYKKISNMQTMVSLTPFAVVVTDKDKSCFQNKVAQPNTNITFLICDFMGSWFKRRN